METLLTITDVGEGIFDDAAALIVEMFYPDAGATTAKVVGPIAKSAEGSYLVFQLRDQSEAPVGAGYLHLIDPSGAVEDVDETVAL